MTSADVTRIEDPWPGEGAPVRSIVLVLHGGTGPQHSPGGPAEVQLPADVRVRPVAAAPQQPARNVDPVAALGRSLVASTCSLRRSQLLGTAGAAHRFLSRHQLSHEFTAARLRFQVDSPAVPQSPSTTSPISTSVTSGSWRSSPSWPMTLSMTPA